MMYKNCKLLKPKLVKDELGNLVDDGFNIVLSTNARFSPWSAEDIALYGTEYTRNVSKYALPVPRIIMRGIDSVLIEGVKYSIESVQEISPRWLAIHVRANRDES